MLGLADFGFANCGVASRNVPQFVNYQEVFIYQHFVRSRTRICMYICIFGFVSWDYYQPVKYAGSLEL